VTPELHSLYVAAGLRTGRERTCDKRIAYASEEAATSATDILLNQNAAARNTLEAYPCGFCKKWHVGQKTSETALLAIAYELFAADELAAVPTSLLLRDVIAHACDRFDDDQLCARCRGKWDEIDRRFPTRTAKT
jgi:hypothetical protein